MTLPNAEKFLAFDIQAYLFITLIILIIIAGVDRFIVNKKKYSVEDKNLIYKAIRFFSFLSTSKKDRIEERPEIVRICIDIYPVLLLVFLLRGVMLEPFKIPSNSMMPTLLTGDFIVVSKLNYGINIPILNKKIIEFSKPEKGDVVVFRYPNYEKNPNYSGTDFIKRVIGTPGDEIIYKNDNLSINGIDIDTNKIGSYVGFGAGVKMTGFKHITETIGESRHEILLSNKSHSEQALITVPEGHYFVMGDNRSRSSDSRFWGFVPEEYIIGKAFGIWMHWGDEVRLNRIGSID